MERKQNMELTKKIEHGKDLTESLGLDTERLVLLLKELGKYRDEIKPKYKSETLVKIIEIANCPEEIALISFIVGISESCSSCPIPNLIDLFS